MNVLDENIIESQRRQLASWRIPVRQIGHEIGRRGMQDEEIIPFLHRLNRPTFFTRDDDFYDYRLCHAGYCLIHLDVRKEEAAVFIRRLLRHPKFKTKDSRMGSVIRVSHAGLSIWRHHANEEERMDWE